MELEKLDAWRPLLAEELKKPYFAALAERVDAAYETQTVFPPREELFTAFELTPPEAVRVVILGQDPYHEPGQAHGLAFSVRRGVKLPPSLRNHLSGIGERPWYFAGKGRGFECMGAARGAAAEHGAHRREREGQLP